MKYALWTKKNVEHQIIIIEKRKSIIENKHYKNELKKYIHLINWRRDISMLLLKCVTITKKREAKLWINQQTTTTEDQRLADIFCYSALNNNNNKIIII